MNALTSRLAVVLAHWQDEDTTLECLAHLAQAGIDGARWILVDNGSRDGSPERIRLRYPDLICIRHDENLGHAAAANAGIRMAHQLGCEHVFLLDNDAFVAPTAVSDLLNVIESRPDAGIVTPRILSGRRPGQIWYDGGSLTVLGTGRHDNMWRQSHDVERIQRDISFATSCAMMVRLEAFLAAGPFDETFIGYADDLDFSIRVLRSGYAIVHAPAAEVTHGESRNVIAMAGKQYRDYFDTRNQLIVQWRYGSAFQRMVGVPIAILRNGLLRALLHALRGDWARVRAVTLGVVDFIRGRTGWGSL